MSKKQSNRRGTSNAATSDVEGNVDKIRDILFGGQMREIEQRLDAIEKNLSQAIERAKRDMERRVDRLDKYTRREVDKLSEQVKTERKERVADGKKGAGDLNNLTEQVETWFGEVDEQLAQEAKDLRSALHDQGEDLTRQIAETRSALQEALAKETSTVADTKVAREDLAELFTEIAMRLNKDFKLPKT